MLLKKKRREKDGKGEESKSELSPFDFVIVFDSYKGEDRFIGSINKISS